MPLRIVISGSHGLLGSALVQALQSGGHKISRLTRSDGPCFGEEIAWQPTQGRIDAAALEGQDVVIHLAGENIGAGRWSDARKKEIYNSRVLGTELLSQTLARLENPPKVFLSASAIGIYGNRGDELLTEDSPAGNGFLAEVCKAWEAATAPAAARGIRVVNLRFGMLLSPDGGGLGKMLGIFKKGLGGPIAGGKQYMSWVALSDAVSAILHLMRSDDVSGPVNIVSPKPVTNKEFTQTLAEVLSKPAFMPLPGFAAKLAMGEMAEELLISSQRVQPKKLKESSFYCSYDSLDSALRSML